MCVALGVLGVTVVVHGATRKVDFSESTVGQPPQGFEFGHTAKAGAPGKWIVQSEGDNQYLAQVDPDNTRARFPVAVVMRPKLELLMLTFGVPQFGWLSTLMASIRNSRLFTSDSLIRLLALMSKRSEEGPRK
jgi:hypothetical protein